MRNLLKRTGLIFSLIAACLMMPSCNNDDKDEPTPVADASTKIIANWQMTNIFLVTIDENGNVDKQEGRMMQSSEWEFRNDGYQYVTLDGYPAKERYRYTVKGNELTLIQEVDENPEIRKGTVTIANGTMTLCLYEENTKKEYTEYTFQQVK